MAENRIQIQSINNEKVKYLQSLKDKKTRNQEKKFLVEGFHLVEEAAKTLDLQMTVTTDESYISSIPFASQVEILIVTPVIIEKLSTTVHPQQILGVVKMPDYGQKQLEKLLQTLEVKLSSNTVDLYNEKVIRATQGTLFKIPMVKMNLQEAIAILKKHQVKCYGTCLQQAKSLQEIQIDKKIAICFGNEARGISQPILEAMDERVTIEMKNHVESLNVAIASAIIMYEWMNKA